MLVVVVDLVTLLVPFAQVHAAVVVMDQLVAGPKNVLK